MMRSMNEIKALLSAVPFFSRLTPAQLEQAAQLWGLQPLQTGDVLWEQDTAAAGLAIVVEGALSVESSGVAVSRLEKHALVGESSAFFPNISHSATLRAAEPTVVLTLSRNNLIGLKKQRNEEMRTFRALQAWEGQGRLPMFTVLIEQGLLTVTRRIRTGLAELTHPAAKGKACPSRERVSTLAKLWKSSRLGLPLSKPPPLPPMMRRLPRLDALDDATMGSFARMWTPEKFERGHIFFLEGEPSDAAYILVEGKVGEMACQSVGKSLQLRSLEPGGLFGDNGMIEKDHRAFSCIAASPGWVYRVDPVEFRRFNASSDFGIRWTETLLVQCIAKLRLVNLCHTVDSVLDATDEGLGRSRVDFPGLLKLSGAA
ncbi:MAG: CRP-like cAMP-binding protein [Myxococcota bacterium]|jgi:CRP-like cAMP-binding protein